MAREREENQIQEKMESRKWKFNLKPTMTDIEVAYRIPADQHVF